MTTDSRDRPTNSKPGRPSWLKRVILFAILGAVLVIVYFILAAFLPRWWAERIGELSDRGFARGITWGLLFGGLCTLVPLLQVLLAVLFRHKRGGRVIAGIATLLALLFMLPNLMTLSIVLGGNNAAHAGQRIMDVEAPGFRGASLVGDHRGAGIRWGGRVDNAVPTSRASACGGARTVDPCCCGADRTIPLQPNTFHHPLAPAVVMILPHSRLAPC